MGENPAQISDWLDQIFAYGPFWVYTAIFLACFIENIFPPFPGDSFILAAGGLVAIDRLDLYGAALAVLVGGVGSVMVLHRFGRQKGREFFFRKNYKYFSKEDIESMQARFERQGALILIGSRFVVGFRSALAIAAGISRYSSVRMLIFSSISYFLFGGLLMYIAIVLVENFDLLMKYIRTYNLILWPIVIFVIGFLIWRKVAQYRKSDK
ncbi:MAG: DedA family protein [bacterium]|nr:DedA family protein [bacterium]